MIKPDGVQRGLVAEIIKRFEQKGFKLVAIKFMKVRLDMTDDFLQFFFTECKDKLFSVREYSQI